jgi:methyl-accepting chemotaxis protein
MLKKIIKEGYIGKLLLIILGITLIFTLFSSIILYTTLDIPLSPHYGALFTNVGQLKESLIFTTVKVNILFFLFIAVGVVVLGILYSHRIAGPLYRVTQYAKSINQGKFDSRIRFRKKDAIHDLATALNQTVEGYQNKAKTFVSRLEEIVDTLKLLDAASGGSTEEDELVERLRLLDKEFNEEIKKIKL